MFMYDWELKFEIWVIGWYITGVEQEPPEDDQVAEPEAEDGLETQQMVKSLRDFKILRMNNPMTKTELLRYHHNSVHPHKLLKYLWSVDFGP